MKDQAIVVTWPRPSCGYKKGYGCAWWIENHPQTVADIGPQRPSLGKAEAGARSITVRGSGINPQRRYSA